MSGRTRGAPAALEEFTRITVPAVSSLAAPIGDVQLAVTALSTAASDLEVAVVDRSAAWLEWCGTTRAVDELPAAFAFALRELDAGVCAQVRAGIGPRPTGGGTDPVLDAHDEDALALALAWLAHPYATTDALLDDAAGGVCVPLGGVGSDPLLPWYWTGLTGADLVAVNLAEAMDLALVGAGTTTPGWWTHALRWANGIGVGLAGAGHYAAIRHDPNLTTGVVASQVTAAALLDGGLGVLGASGGIVVGAPLGPAGVALGGITGGLIGGVAGGVIRESEPVSWAVDGIGEALDRLLGTGHDDEYDDTILAAD